MNAQDELRLFCPKHRAHQPERASARLVRRRRKPEASALRLMTNPAIERVGFFATVLVLQGTCEDFVQLLEPPGST
jgi:hypothetical protein